MQKPSQAIEKVFLYKQFVISLVIMVPFLVETIFASTSITLLRSMIVCKPKESFLLRVSDTINPIPLSLISIK